MTTDSQQLLAEYTANGSEKAFQELAARYVDLVYSTAVRLVDGDTHQARDVAQTVFVDLARMAAKLSPNTMLGGWLHRHTCFVARTVMRGERRRQARERQAVEMSALENHPDTALAEIRSVLDEAIDELGPDDRDAILLRFYEHRNLRSVGEALGTSENVAQKRVARAVQELATLLRHRGFSLSATALASGLAAGAVKAAPAGLAMGLAKIALAKVGATGGIGMTSAKVAAVTKLKVGVVSVMIVAGVAVTVFLQGPSKAKRSDESQLAPQPVADPQVVEQQNPPAAVQADFQAPVDESSNVAKRAPEPVQPIHLETRVVAVRSVPAATAPEEPIPGFIAGQLVGFFARSGSRLRIEGTSNFHNWRAESPIIAGFLEIDPGFFLDTPPAAKAGPVRAQAEVFTTVRSLRSVEKDGRPYSDKMDEIMYDYLKAKDYPKIIFRLTELSLTERGKDVPHPFEAKGDLVVAGVTNNITLPVDVLPLVDGKLKISGRSTLTMSSFQIHPPAPKLAVGLIKTGDEVTIQFDWVVAPRGVASGSPR